MAERILATYHIETAHDLIQAAQIMAGEQSAGTFVKVPGETPELLERHGARIERITELETVANPTLPGSRPPKNVDNPIHRRAEVVLSFPFENVGANLPVLMSTVSGNLFELAPFSGLKLLDVEIPQPFYETHPGPQFGVQGTRDLAGVMDRPLIGTIIKPSVGLSPTQTADLVKTLCEAGIDFIKDDELMGNSPHSPFIERVQAVMDVINDHAQKTGKKVMFAFNISADIDTMRKQHDLVLDHGGTCVMVNMLSVGLVGVLALSQHSQLPIHGHRNGWGMLSRQPYLGMSYLAFQKLFRLAGTDQLHVNGLRNKFCESDQSVIDSARTCLSPIAEHRPVMPVFSSGQWAGQAPDTYQVLDSVDLMYLAGGGIMGHPDGPAAGVQSLQQAWEAAIQGISLPVYAKTRPALKHALERYGAL